MTGFSIAGYAIPGISFVGGTNQSFNICANTSQDLSAFLAANTAGPAATITWTVTVAPSHGTITGLPYSMPSGGATTTPPTGTFYYVPTFNFGSNDAFTVMVSDGTTTALTTFGVIVHPITAIAGANSVCGGQTITLSDGAAGGTWSSSDASLATVGSINGVVTGTNTGPTAPGTVTITYSMPSGCSLTTTITSNPLAPITGAGNICAWGSTVQLSDAATNPTPGAWSSTLAPVNTTGLVTSMGAGVATITYTMPTGCQTTTTLTVNPLPAPILIGSTTAVCVGSSISFSDQSGGGTWSSSNTSMATVNASGNVTGASAGSLSIIYTLPGNGCTSTQTITVNPLPGSISPNNACLGQIVTLSSLPSGGTWSTSSTSITLNPTTGAVTGIVIGTATVTYTLPTGCLVTGSLTVNPLPGPITGITLLCQSSTVTLSDAGGGTWMSSNSAIAAVGVNTGVVLGTGGGTVNITYTLPTGCIATTSVTVNAIGVITGPTDVCLGATTNLFDIPSGGIWSSSNANATIGSANGHVTGINVGTTTITYSTSAGCFNTRTETVDSLPTLTGESVCAGSRIILPHSPTGGTWSSSNTSVATIRLTSVQGHVHGVSAGTAVITYTAPTTGCVATASVIVNAITPIAGGNNACSGNTIQLSDAATGGTWSSNNTAVASVNSVTGLVTAQSVLTTSTATITYTTPAGCTATILITVYPLPGTITGTFNVCQGLSTNLFDIATPGGAWSSSNTSIATVVAGTGVVTGVSGGVANITYQLGTGCSTVASFTVNPTGTISGIPYTCVGTQTTLTEVGPPGTWVIALGSGGIASVGPTSGIVTGISNGVAIIDYVVTGTACVATYSVTVGALPPISGPSAVCVGSTIALSDIIAGGVWSSSNTAWATVDGSGNVTGVSGTHTPSIIYTLVAGCSSSKPVTVNALPTLAGASVCVGSAVNLVYFPVFGGTWSSSNTSVATLNTTLFVTANGVSAGLDTITYTLNTGCSVTNTVLVNPLPAPITGNLYICAGITTALSDATPGGVWSSSNSNLATIGSASGIATGVATGTPNIFYTLSATGCRVSAPLSVNTLPAIQPSPSSKVCVGQSIGLSDIATGGTWSSMDATIGAVNASGVVTGMATGTTIITYTLGGTCRAITSVVVDALSPIIGNTTVCVGATITLSDTTFGGTWSSANPAVAAVNAATGVVTGVNGGKTDSVVYISYTLPTGCTISTSVTVNPLPTPIAGIGSGVCLGSFKTLSDGIAGGTWSSSNNTIATIDPVAGVVTGLMTGTVTITYALPTGCTAATAVLSVNALPVLTSSLTPPAICNNTLFNYPPTSNLGVSPIVTFQWQRNAVTGISNPLNTGSGNPDTNPGEVLHDTTTNPVAVQYVYQLYVSATSCVSTYTVTVIVNPTPTLTSLPLYTGNICDSTLFTYISTSATPSVTYTWHRPTVTGISNPAASGVGDTIREVLVNTSPTVKVVTYIDTLWFAGCSHTQSVTVTVNPSPVLSNLSHIGTTVCDSTQFTYIATSATPSVTYTWHRVPMPPPASVPGKNGVGATIRDTVVNHSPNPIVVTYIDTLWYSNTNCWNIQIVTDTVNPRPVLSNIPLNPLPICDSINYSPISATTSATFDWTRPYIPGIGLLAGSGTNNPNEVLVNTTNTDVTVTYHYTIWTADHRCSNTQDVHVVVHPKPLLSSDPGPFTVCSGSPFTYGPTGYVFGTTFKWTRGQVTGIGPSSGSGTGNINETLTDSTFLPKNVIYNYILTDSYSVGPVCRNSASISVKVNPSYQAPAITTHSSNTVCLHTMLQNFGVASPATAGVQYTWGAENATIWAYGTPNQYVLVNFDSFAGPAVITVSTNVTGYGCQNTQAFYVTVGSTIADNISIIYHNNQFMCLQNNEDTYQWGFDDAITLDSTILIGETNQTYFCNSPDLTYRHYWVMTTRNGCLQKSFYNSPVGVNNVNTDVTEVKIYPNPANDIINVDINTQAGGKYEVEVLDVLGQKINMVTAVNRRAKINVANLPAGIYMIETYRDGIKINAARFIKN